MKGFSGTTETFFLGVIASFILLVQFGLFGGCAGDPSPRDGANQDCEEAWVVEYDGDDETNNETAILDQDWCQAHLGMVESQQVVDQREQQQELQQVQGVAP